jgi:hypothetical protein
MKNWVYFNPGSPPEEYEEYDPKKVEEGGLIYNSQTNRWFLKMGLSTIIIRQTEVKRRVPSEYLAWLLIL